MARIDAIKTGMQRLADPDVDLLSIRRENAVVEIDKNKTSARSKIGRASCRERV